VRSPTSVAYGYGHLGGTALPPDAALDRLDPTGRFTNRAEDYAKHRPSYPDAAIDAVLMGLGAPPDLVAADVGAGTGISSRALAARGLRVVAIEPNAAMRAKAEPHPRVEWRDGTGERTGLPPASVDLVLCAQAFHWLDPEPRNSTGSSAPWAAPPSSGTRRSPPTRSRRATARSSAPPRTTT
jgi:SAM-dependent methyltransferase